MALGDGAQGPHLPTCLLPACLRMGGGILNVMIKLLDVGENCSILNALGRGDLLAKADVKLWGGSCVELKWEGTSWS